MRIKRILSLSIASLALATAASAQVLISLPDESQTTTFTATIDEQATVTVPTDIAFHVTNVLADTASTDPSPVTVTGIVLTTTTKKLKISVKGSAFTGSSTPYSTADVLFTGGDWTTTATASSGNLNVDHSTYATLATCNANEAACSTADAGFSLKANSAVTTNGTQSLTMTWKFESI